MRPPANRPRDKTLKAGVASVQALPSYPNCISSLTYAFGKLISRLGIKISDKSPPALKTELPGQDALPSAGIWPTIQGNRRRPGYNINSGKTVFPANCSLAIRIAVDDSCPPCRTLLINIRRPMRGSRISERTSEDR
jgi:hypothetical protein